MYPMVLKVLFLGLFCLSAALAHQEDGAKASKDGKPARKEIRGSFGQRGEGIGIVLLNGNLFIEAIVVHQDVVESGIFLVDSGTRTGCVMETYFAERMKVMGLGNITLKFGEAEIKHVKATVLDHPNLQQIFKDNTALFQNRPISGVIGYPVLAAKLTVLDFQSFTAVFRPLPEKPEEGKKDDPAENPKLKGVKVLPYRDDGKTIWLDIRLNDKADGVFQVRTGSPFSWVGKETAEKAGLRKEKAPRSLKADGVELAPLPIALRILKESPVPENAADFPVAGCLGTDFLAHFKVTIDPVNKRLLLN